MGYGNFFDMSQCIKFLYIPTLMIPPANKDATMVLFKAPEGAEMSAPDPSRWLERGLP